MKAPQTNIRLTLEHAQGRAYTFASELIYSILVSIRITELIDEPFDSISFLSLKNKTPELYKIVLYSAVVSIDKRHCVN